MPQTWRRVAWRQETSFRNDLLPASSDYRNKRCGVNGWASVPYIMLAIDLYQRGLFSTLKMEAVSFSTTMFHAYRADVRHIPDDNNFRCIRHLPSHIRHNSWTNELGRTIFTQELNWFLLNKVTYFVQHKHICQGSGSIHNHCGFKFIRSSAISLLTTTGLSEVQSQPLFEWLAEAHEEHYLLLHEDCHQTEGQHPYNTTQYNKLWWEKGADWSP
jgi:hypothetical protein